MRKVMRALLAVFVVLGFTGAVQAATLKMKAALYFDEHHAWYKGLEKFKDVIRAKSNGTLDLEIYGRGVLGGEKDYIQQMMEGFLDMSALNMRSGGSLGKEVTFLGLMGLFKDRDHWKRALDGEAGRLYAQVIERMTAKRGNPGLKVLGYWGGTPRQILSRKRGYTTVADLAGFRMRSTENPTSIEMWKLVGVIPTPIAYMETYNAIQTGVVEGLENNMDAAFNMKFYEVAPHISETAHELLAAELVMSGQTWNKLTPEQQKIVLEAAKEATEVSRISEFQEAQEAVVKMEKVGVKFYPFKEKEKLMELTLAYKQRVAKETGLTNVLDAIERAAKP